MRVRTVLLLLPVILSSCLGTKYLKKDESVLRKQKIKTSGNLLTEDLRGQLSQTPNTRLGGAPIAHLFHIKKLGEIFYDSANVAANREKIDKKYRHKIDKANKSKKKAKLNTKRTQKLEKKDKKLKQGNQFMRWGEDLAIFDSSKVDESVFNLNNYLFSKGYFEASIETNIKTENKKSTVTYFIDAGKPYQVDSMIYIIKDPNVEQLFMKYEDEQLLMDKQYDQDLFGEERTRVFDLMTNNGYYNFKKQFIVFEVDSTALTDRNLIVRQTITNPPNTKQHKSYRLDSVIFSADMAGASRYLKPIEYNNITYNFKGTNYSERLLSRRIFLSEDSLYSKELTLETQRQLSYLDIFKFVNINYDTTGGEFIANIFTSPLKKYQTSSEAGLSLFESQGSIPGPFVNLNVKGRNIFGGLEIIQFDGNVSVQGLDNVNSEDNNQNNLNYSRLQYGGKISLTFPQFIFPFSEQLRNAIGKYNPRTKLSAGVNFEERIGEYKRNTVNANMAYIWQVGERAQYTITPFDANYIFSITNDEFDELLKDNSSQSIIASFNPSFFTFSAFSARFNYGNYGVGNNDSHFIQTSIESGGNLLGIFNNLSSFQDLENFQYLRGTFEYRENIKLTRRSALAYRVNLGLAYSYGSNGSLPYEKYFFAGGSNSIRAWAPRRLGPGAYAQYDSASAVNGIVSIDYTTERAGDILLESSIEFRSNLVGFIDYALFLDAGNMWLWKSAGLKDDGSEFIENENDDGKFNWGMAPNQIAIGTGFGLRLDFSFLVLRLDLAYRVLDPGLPKGDRFLLDNYKLNTLWKEPTLNIGIGYPF